MKRKFVTIALLAVVAVGYWQLSAPFRVIRRLEACYQQVQRGMTTNQVQAIMGDPGHWHTNAVYMGWDDTPVSSEVPFVSCAASYPVRTFFLGVTFEFTFDESGRAVGKHRYD